MQKIKYPSSQFDDVIAAACAGIASADDLAMLADVLIADPLARHEYLLRVELHARLASEPKLYAGGNALAAGSSKPADDVMPSAANCSLNAPSPLPQSSAGLWEFLAGARAWAVQFGRFMAYFLLGGPVGAADRRSTAAALTAAYVVFYGAFLSLLWSMNPQRVDRGPRQMAELAHLAAEEAAKGVATLVRAEDCQWEVGQPPLSVGDRIAAAQHVRPCAGHMVLRFDSGAEVGIVGPAEARLNSVSHLFLERGQLAAHVPARACGFTVETRTARLVDLGTDFAVDVGASGETKATVTRGAVEVTALSQVSGKRMIAEAPLRITAGQSVCVSPAGRKAVIDRGAQTPEWVKVMKLSEEAPTAVIAYQSPNGAPGNHSNSIWTVGLDFEVARPVQVESLGVFDDLSDGITSESQLTVQLWSRDNRGTPQDRRDDVGGKVLAEFIFDTSSQGILIAGHRFKPLARPLELPAGSYSIVAHGFREHDRFVDFKFPNLTPLPSPRAIETWRGAIAHIGSRWGSRPGEFPNTVDEKPYCYVAGSFKFRPSNPPRPRNKEPR